MGFWSTIAAVAGIKGVNEPIVKKDIEESNLQLQELHQLSKRVKDEKKREEIIKDMLLFQIGLDGEKSVMYELKNSNVPMIILHDIRLESATQSAQIDFVIIMHEYILLLETKKLQGDIEITSEGDFIRHFKNSLGKTYKKEGVYSPVVQNQRHVEVLRKMLVGAGIIKNMPVYSKVIVASPKTIITKSKAPKEIANQIHKADQISSVLKKTLHTTPEVKEETMVNIYKYLLTKHTPQQYDLLSRYNLTAADLLEGEIGIPSLQETADFMKKVKAESYENYKNTQTSPTPSPKVDKPNVIQITTPVVSVEAPNISADITSSLRSYRSSKAKSENIPPYFIFSDAELQELGSVKPKTIISLGKIKGFGPKKLEKYGKEIVEIINNCK